MGLWDSICSGLSSVCSVVSSAASWAVSGLSSAAGYLGSALSSALSVGGGLLGAVGNIASDLLQGLGIFGKDEKPEDLGDRALQAHELDIVPEKFDNFSQYMETLRNFDLDPQKTKESTLDQKIFKGLEVGGRALEDKFNAPEGSMASVWQLAAANPAYFTADRFQSILSGGMDIPSIVDYFEGRLGGGEALEIEDQLVDVDQHANPGKDENTSRQDIYAMAERSNNTYE